MHFTFHNTIAHPSLLDVDQSTILSLRLLLEKLFTLHHHIRTIARIAWSRQLAPFLEGQFNVVYVPEAHSNISINLSEQNVLPVIFPTPKPVKLKVKQTVYNELLKRLQVEAGEQGVVMKTGTATGLELKANVHAECNLLAYHLQHPQIDPYHYFGGSKLSCHGCGTLFSSFNLLAESFGLPKFFTRGCHSKIYLQWPCPSLLSQEQQMRLQSKDPSLDTEVRKGMVMVLCTELAKYVDKLCAVAEGLPLNRTSCQSWLEALERLEAMLETGM